MKQIYCGFHQFLFFILTPGCWSSVLFFLLRKNIKLCFKIAVCPFLCYCCGYPCWYSHFSFKEMVIAKDKGCAWAQGHLPPTFTSDAPVLRTAFYSKCLWRPGESSLVSVWLPRSSEVGGLEESGCYEHAEMQTGLLDGHQRPDISQLQAGARHSWCKIQVQAKPRGGVTVVHPVPLWCSAVEEKNTSQNFKNLQFWSSFTFSKTK